MMRVIMSIVMVVVCVCVSVSAVPLSSQHQSTIEQMSNIFDHSSPDNWYTYCERLVNGNHRPYFLAGRSSVSSQDGTMLQVLVAYENLRPNNGLVPYMNALAVLFSSATDGTAYHDSETFPLFSPSSTFVIDWYMAARDPLFRQAQDQVHYEYYYQYIGQYMSQLGLDTPLSYSILYDTMIQTGDDVNADTRISSPLALSRIIHETSTVMESTPASGRISEHMFMQRFLEIRRALLSSSAVYRLASSINRIRVYQSLMSNKQWDLRLPLTFTFDNQTYTLVDDSEKGTAEDNTHPAGLGAIFPPLPSLNEAEALSNSPHIATDSELTMASSPIGEVPNNVGRSLKGIVPGDSASPVKGIAVLNPNAGIIAPSSPSTTTLHQQSPLVNHKNVNDENFTAEELEWIRTGEMADPNKITHGLPYGVAGILPHIDPASPVTPSSSSFSSSSDETVSSSVQAALASVPLPTTTTQKDTVSLSPIRRRLQSLSSFIDYKNVHSAYHPQPTFNYKLSSVSTPIREVSQPHPDDRFNTHDHSGHTHVDPSSPKQPFRHRQQRPSDVIQTPLGDIPVSLAQQQLEEREEEELREVPIVSAVQPPVTDEHDESPSHAHQHEHVRDNDYNTVERTHRQDHTRHHHASVQEASSL